MKESTAIRSNTTLAISSRPIINYPPIPVIAGKLCNMEYLKSITRGDEKKIQGFVTMFLTETQYELSNLDIAIEKANYIAISEISHKMKSVFAILGIQILEPVIKEMEQLSIMSSSIDIIKQLSQRINTVFSIAMSELKSYN